jgi:hypothetical protein
MRPVFTVSLYACSAVLITLLSFAGELVEGQPTSPKMQTSETTFDFGISLFYRPVAHIFKVKNIGNANLILMLGKASCGCTVRTLRDREVAPGVTTEIEVGYDPKKREKSPGQHNFTVEVQTNDQDQPKIILSIKGQLVDQVNTQQRVIDFGLVGENKSFAQNLRIDCFHDGGFPSITSIKTNSTRLTLGKPNVEKSSIKRSYLYEVRLDLNNVSSDFNSLITVETDSKQVPILEIPVRARFTSPISADPPRVLFGLSYSDQEKTKKVSLRSSAPGTQVHGAECANGQIKLGLTKNPEDNGAVLNVILKPGPAPAKPTTLRDSIVLLDINGVKVGEVPIHALIMPPK